jgi:hypothetical protein
MAYFSTDLLSPRESTLEFLRSFARNYRSLTLDDGEKLDVILG